MGTVITDQGGEYEPIPTGMHRAVMVNYYDVGRQPGYQGGKPQEKVVFLWELEARNSEGKRFTITKIYTKNIGEKSNLGNDLVSWRGRPFTDEERAGFDLDRVKGKPCQLNIIPNGDKVKIGTVLPPSMETVNGQHRISQHWNPETPFGYVPKFVQKMIDTQIIPGLTPARPETARPGRQPGDDFVDDIPFDKPAVPQDVF